MSSATRSLRNRSSRSSPATFIDKEAPARTVEVKEIKDGRESDADAWVEPAVRNAVPSFEDTKGLERLGVLEHMAPLGVAPTQKLLQKLKISFHRSSPRATPFPVDDVDISMVEAPDTEVPSPVETEFLPDRTTASQPAIISTPPRGRPAKKDADEMRQAVALFNGTPSPTKTLHQSNHSSPKPQSIQDFLRQDRMRNSVYKAIDEANQSSDNHLVPGLVTILEDAKSKQSLWNVLDAIVNRSPSDAQFRVFKRYIKRGVRQYRNASSEHASPSQTGDQIHFRTPQSDHVGQDHVFPNHHTRQPSDHELLNNGNSISRVKSPHHKLQNAISPSPHKAFSPVVGQQMRPSALSATDPQSNRTRHRGRKRSTSASSASSLSSAKSLPEEDQSATEEDGTIQVDGRRRVRSAGQRQAANSVAASSRTRSSLTTNQPDITQPPLGTTPTIRFINKKLHKTKHRESSTLDKQEIEEKKRNLIQQSFNDYNNIDRPESNERTHVNGLPISRDSLLRDTPPPVVHRNPLQASTGTLLSSHHHQAEPDSLILNGTARKRAYDEMDGDERGSYTPPSSSPAPSVPPPPPGAVRGSTPRSSRFPAPNRARKSARVMISPNKPKNGGITAGFSRIAASKESNAMNGTDSGGEDNDEFCASCGGEGTLLCCDGCTNSFHHACLEPPLDPDHEVEGEWFCPQCIARRNKQPLPTTGLLARIIRRVDDIIPKAFSLPFEIRDYFEGVKTGDEGEYEEISIPRTQTNVQKMNRAGFFEQPNYKELRDTKGNLITCYNCGETASGRDIIPCDFCPAKWHTDCVTPPMAVPPRRTGGDKPNGYWKCPLHCEHDYASISREAELAFGDKGRMPRLRKPKHAIPIDIDMTRGFRNNGIIEVELIKEEMPDIKEVSLDGGIYRLPEKGIRLDFIDRVKKNWYEDHTIPLQSGKAPKIRSRLYRPGHAVLHHPSAFTVVRTKEPEFIRSAQALAIAETAKANAQLRQKSIVEQSAIVAMIGMADHKAVGIGADPLTDLVNQLIADAPSSVEEEMRKSEREALLKLQELVSQRLSLLDTTKAADEKDAVPAAGDEQWTANTDINLPLTGEDARPSTSADADAETDVDADTKAGAKAGADAGPDAGAKLSTNGTNGEQALEEADVTKAVEDVEDKDEGYNRAGNNTDMETEMDVS